MMSSGGGEPAPIVALFPAAPGVPVSDYPPYRAAVEAARSFNSSGVHEFPREVTIVPDDGAGGTQAIELLGEGCSMEIPCRCALPLLVLQVKDLGACGIWGGAGGGGLTLPPAQAHSRQSRYRSRTRTGGCGGW